MTQLFGDPTGADGAHTVGQHITAQGKGGAQQHQAAQHKNRSHLSGRGLFVNDGLHQAGDEQLKGSGCELNEHRQHNIPGIGLYVRKQSFHLFRLHPLSCLELKSAKQ